MSLLFLFIALGVLIPEPKASYDNPTEETAFYHIMRKSKDFPQISKLDCMETAIQKTEFLPKNHHSSLKAALGMVPKTNFSDMVIANMLTSDMETADVENYSSGKDGVVNISKGLSSTNSIQSSNFVPIVGFSMSKEKNWSSGSGSFEQSSKKQRCSLIESKEEKLNACEIRRQYCSLENTGQMNQIESCLGFKSVFSFL